MKPMQFEISFRMNKMDLFTHIISRRAGKRSDMWWRSLVETSEDFHQRHVINGNGNRGDVIGTAPNVSQRALRKARIQTLITIFSVINHL